MDLNRLTREADDLIRKVVSRYNQLYVPAGSISQVELDLMLDDLRKLYDTFKTIGQVNLALQQNPPKPEVTVKPSTTAATPLYQETTPEPTFSPQKQEPQPAAAQPEPEHEPAVQQYTEPEPEVESEPEIPSATEQVFEFPEATAAEQEIPEEPKTVSAFETVTSAPAEPEPIKYEEKAQPETLSEARGTEASPSMLADKFVSGNKSLSETIASVPAHDVFAGRMQFQPITDLSTGIGLNDKFSFISELFSNNPALYEEAITRINKAVNHDEASWILNKYHSDDWNQKHDSLSRLKDFIKRRFI